MEDGIGLATIIKIGIILQTIRSRMEHLLRSIDESLTVHNLYEHFPTSSTQEDISKNQKEIISKVLSEAKDINKMIKGSNSIIRIIEYKKKIVPLDLITLRKLVRLRFKSVHAKKEAQELSNENFRLKIHRQFSKSRISINDFIALVEAEQEVEGLSKLKENYKNGINAAINIYSTGHHKTSIFVVGRTVEKVLDDLIRVAMKKGKLKRVSIPQIKYEKKIGILKTTNIINEKLFHDLSSVRIDRNKTGHPIRRIFKKDENKLVISSGINLILRLQKILKRLERP